MSISRSKNGCKNGLTHVNVSAFAMKVVQREKDLSYYALCGGDGEPVLPRWAKSLQARAQGVRHEAYMRASCAIGNETIPEGQKVIEPRTIGIRSFDLLIHIVLGHF